MNFSPLNTQDHTTSYRKCLLYGIHGWGKTTQCKHYQEHYGPGFIISGESGLSSVRNAGIDYLPFTSWDGETNPDEGKYSFRSIFEWIRSDDFKQRGYKWICIDSLTELSDHSVKHAEIVANRQAEKTKKNVNGFEIWQNHGAQLIGACKAIRDLPMHVLVTALAKKSQDSNGNTEYWPMIAGNSTKEQLPGIFDCVFCGVMDTSGSRDNGLKTVRYVITTDTRGWKGKVRDEERRLDAVERTGNIVDLMRRMDATPEQYAKWLEKKESASE